MCADVRQGARRIFLAAFGGRGPEARPAAAAGARNAPGGGAGWQSPKSGEIGGYAAAAARAGMADGESGRKIAACGIRSRPDWKMCSLHR